MQVSSSWTHQKPLFLVSASAIIFGAILFSSASAAEKSATPKGDEVAIRATTDALQKVFNRGDAKALAALWSENGTVVDDRNTVFKGRKAIEVA